jgi:phosphatidylcholine synthase
MSTETSVDRRKSPVRVVLAYGVHLFTATGAVWGLLGLRAIFEHEWKMMIFWMILAMFVDGVDGMLARWADVKTYAVKVDGALLDNIVDYLNYVVVPALFLVEAPEILPDGLAYPIAFAILLASAYQFTQVDAKTDESHEYFFKGFPCYWNVVALYMLILDFDPWVNAGLLVLFNILIFVPIKYVYPSRNRHLRRFTLILSYLYGLIGVWGLMHYPDVPQWVIWASFLYVVYYLGLSLWPRRADVSHAV